MAKQIENWVFDGERLHGVLEQLSRNGDVRRVKTSTGRIRKIHHEKATAYGTGGKVFVLGTPLFNPNMTICKDFMEKNNLGDEFEKWSDEDKQKFRVVMIMSVYAYFANKKKGS